MKSSQGAGRSFGQRMRTFLGELFQLTLLGAFFGALFGMRVAWKPYALYPGHHRSSGEGWAIIAGIAAYFALIGVIRALHLAKTASRILAFMGALVPVMIMQHSFHLDAVSLVGVLVIGVWGSWIFARADEERIEDLEQADRSARRLSFLSGRPHRKVFVAFQERKEE
jgi:hypothetical protein